MQSPDNDWAEAREKANYLNPWFLPEFIDLSVKNIAGSLLDKDALTAAIQKYNIGDKPKQIKTIGIVMAGNIPLVGFHDFLCVFLYGHHQVIKLSAKDDVLLKHLVSRMISWEPEMESHVRFNETLKAMDAYIATGSNHSARYFEQYFARFPHIIRRNRTSIAILDGTETITELSALADDIQLYFGLGCRNVTQVWAPKGYNFQPLLTALEKYDYLMDSHKYKHNYDYVLTINMMNRTAYMTNGSIVLSPATSPFSGISNLNYAYYDDQDSLNSMLEPDTLQVITGHGFTPFGKAQCPGFLDFADGIDTLKFLAEL